MWCFCSWPPCFSHLTGPLVAISLVKDCLFALSGQSEAKQKKVLALWYLPRKGKKKKSPVRPPGLETFTDARNHRKHPEENVPSLSPAPPCFPSPSSAPYRRWIWEQRAWERSKVSRRKAPMTLSWISAKWFDSPTQSQRLRGHNHQTSKMLI